MNSRFDGIAGVVGLVLVWAYVLKQYVIPMFVHMAKNSAPAIVVAVFMVIPTQAQAQSQAASVELAKQAVLEEALFDTYTACVRELLSMGVKSGKALDKCEKVRDRAARNKEKVANEAADSIQKNRQIVIPGYGYGSYGGLGTVGGDPSLGYAVSNGFCPGGRNPVTRVCY